MKWSKFTTNVWSATNGWTICRWTVTAACTGGCGGAGTFYTYEDLDGRSGDTFTTLKATKAAAATELALR